MEETRAARFQHILESGWCGSICAIVCRVCVDCGAYVWIFVDVNVVSERCTYCGRMCVFGVRVCDYADMFEAYIIYVRRYAGNVSM